MATVEMVAWVRMPVENRGFITAIREKGSLEVHWVEHHRSYVETLNKCLGKNDIFYGYTLDELIRMTYQRKSVARI
ncbi:superoxide dismutase [Fe] 3, chloroplastic [Tanacetum coccineum]